MNSCHFETNAAVGANTLSKEVSGLAFVSEWHLSQNGICLKAAFVSEWHLSQSGICLKVAFVSSGKGHMRHWSQRHLGQNGKGPPAFPKTAFGTAAGGFTPRLVTE